MKQQEILISPSILSADFSNLANEIRGVEAAGADILHLDVMDGSFVPNISFGAPVIKSIRNVTDMPFDVHLMVENPQHLIPQFVDAGADYITVHVEATKHIHRTLQMIKDLNVKAGVAINPGSSIDFLPHVIDMLDLILVMSVNPGFGGQVLIPSVLDKIQKIKSIVDDVEKGIIIEVDGGVNADTAPEIVRAGANALVAGNYIFSSSNYQDKIKQLRELTYFNN